MSRHSLYFVGEDKKCGTPSSQIAKYLAGGLRQFLEIIVLCPERRMWWRTGFLLEAIYREPTEQPPSHVLVWRAIRR